MKKRKYIRRQKRINQWLLLLLTIAIVSACTSTPTNQNKQINSQTASTDCRVMQHEMGETCVPQNPEHIVTIPLSLAGSVLTLDLIPVGSTLPFGNQKNLTLTYLGNRTEGINNVGTANEPSIEKILLLEPDLILAWNYSSSIYPQLVQIAPTVVVPYQPPYYWEDFKFMAEVLGKQKAARQAKENYNRRIKKLQIALSKQYQDKKISVIGAFGQNRVYAYAQNSFPGSILQDLGLKRPAAQDRVVSDGVIYNISEERLEVIEGNILFFLMFGGESKESFEKLQQRPLWQKLKAVREKQVYLVEGDAWIGANPLAAHAVLDDIEKYLVE